EPALVVAEEDEVLAEQAHRRDRAVGLELLGERSRLPILTHELAAGRARPDAGDTVVLFLTHHCEAPTVMVSGRIVGLGQAAVKYLPARRGLPSTTRGGLGGVRACRTSVRPGNVGPFSPRRACPGTASQPARARP